jgi:hypothetical protein
MGRDFACSDNLSGTEIGVHAADIGGCAGGVLQIGRLDDCRLFVRAFTLNISSRLASGLLIAGWAYLWRWSGGFGRDG